MLKITGLSLLLGALAWVAGLMLFFAPPAAINQNVPAVMLNATTTRVVLGSGTPGNGKLQVTLNKLGVALVRITDAPIAAGDYPFLHLALEDSSQDLQVSLSWVSSDREQDTQHSYIPESRLRHSLWLATNEIRGWSGNISTISLAMIGQPGEVVSIGDFSIYPASTSRQIRALYSDLTSFTPWNRAAMNSHTGVTNVASFYPVPLVVSYFTLSLLGYGMLLLLFRAKMQFNWRVVALIFFTCWIGLDVVWQKSLLHQMADTCRTFSGKSSPEKLTVGPDAKLYNFAAQVKPLLEPKDARVFVSAATKYESQRSAYFLFPFNVFWPEPGRVFPRSDRNQLHSGDYIVLIKPTDFRFNPRTNELLIPLRRPVKAEQVFSNSTGSVLRLN
ncbi:MAG TPA: hypothetical protein VIV27_01930 [Halioglobus sp.]